MKKIIFTLLALVAVSFSANAQYFGIKGGLNFSNFHQGDEITDQKLRTGYHFGAFVYLPITENFGVQPEVLYSAKGSTASYFTDLGPFGEIDGDVTFKLDYIDVPVLLVFKLGALAEIQVGPYFAFLANSEYEITGDFELADELDNNNFNGIGYGLAGGVAFNIAMFQVGARYNYGLQKVEDSNVADLLLGDSKNSYFQIFAALRFGSYD